MTKTTNDAFCIKLMSSFPLVHDVLHTKLRVTTDNGKLTMEMLQSNAETIFKRMLSLYDES